MKFLQTLLCLVGVVQGMTVFTPAVVAALAPADVPEETIVIEHVTVLPMTDGGAPAADRSVVVRNGRIVAIEPTSSARHVDDARRIDGRGKWLMPGLTDMHVHLDNARLLRLLLRRPDIPESAVRNEDVFLPHIANGVLQVFSLQSMSETIGQRVEIEAGRVLGPHIIAAAMIDGADPIWPVGSARSVANPEAARQAVRDAAAESYDAIKVYSRLELETFTAIVEEARRLKLPVVGHIPGRGKGSDEAYFQPGFGMVAHAEEFAQRGSAPAPDAIAGYVALMKKNGAWLTATLSLNERLLEMTEDPSTLRSRSELRVLHPLWRDLVINRNPYAAQKGPARVEYLRDVVVFNRKLVRAFLDAGIPIVAGTDALVPGIVPGYALHDELAALTRAGMTNLQALEAATRLPCEWLGVLSDRGTVEPGKRADLILLDADPLASIENTRRIHAVILGGRYLSADRLAAELKTLAEKETLPPEAEPR